jgi:hypothetical protein
VTQLASLWPLLNNDFPSIRQGACVAILEQIKKDSLLSKKDLQHVAEKFKPNIVVVQPSKEKDKKTTDPSEKKGKGRSQAEKDLKSDTATYPLDQRGAESQYAVALRAVRMQERASKKAAASE